MSREASITQEQVSVIASEIRSAGGKPTARAVRERLGGGSMATVLKFLQAWHAAQISVSADLSLPPILQRSLLDFVGKEVASARAALADELLMAQQVQADLITEVERLSLINEELAKQIERSRLKEAEQAGQLSRLECELNDTRDEAVRQAQAAEGARTELAKTQLRLEALPRVELDADALRKELGGERRARNDAERQCAAAEARAEGLAARLADVQAVLREAKEHQQEAAGELGQLRREVRELLDAKASAAAVKMPASRKGVASSSVVVSAET